MKDATSRVFRLAGSEASQKEHVMTRKLTIVGLLLASMLSLTLLASCQSTQPFGLTGATGTSASDRVRFTDDKGKFHQDLYIANKALR